MPQLVLLFIVNATVLPVAPVIPAANAPRFWQNSVRFSDGKQAVLTIQSEKGRSDNNERIFVLQALGGVRAFHGWKFNFQGGPQELPTFVPETAGELLSECVPYWIGKISKKVVG